ncbi:DUF1217 domain-containing protein [Rhizobium straminoryzae]|uniref:DUF1217 domain-containing protein n=1 Tax=Rhizobium straminoryzae TaxID=1387186 RepID=A0A549TBS1_9HYPH|nr:DUF1217 domain-containing protein [Rhizobium straminoryzae]TRL39330.1 DUF1217 domain-containing protein [Rhizobium straminoryzae]
MVSTYLSYDLVSRDLQASLKRVSKQTDVSREADYYKANIAKVTSVDDFLNNTRLYNYAMKAYGLSDMAYAKAFMRKVLESDLSDTNSFANKLTDSRYRDFARAFNFSSDEKTAQSSTQIDAMLGLYNSTMVSEGDAVTTETNYFNAMMGEIGNVDDLLNNDRLRSYLFTSYGISENYYSRTLLRGVLSSDTSDPASYINQTLGPQRTTLNTQLTDAQTRLDATTDATARAKIETEITGYEAKLATLQNYFDMADAFQFKADGTVPAGGAQTSAQKATINDLYLSKQERVSTATALNDANYFKQKMATVDNVTDIIGDTRLYKFIKTAYGLTGITVVTSTIEQILTSDLTDPNSYANRFGKSNPAYLQLAKDFNFKTDGTVTAGSAQTTTQQDSTVNRYYSTYNDAQDAADEKAATAYQKAIGNIKTVSDFMNNKDVYTFALKAVGIDPSEVSVNTMKRALTSDLNDSKSYIYTLKDDRFVQLAKSFNFDTKGNVKAPLTAQPQGTITSIGSEYTIKMTRFLTDTAKDKAKTDAAAEVKYYSTKMMTMQSPSEFINDSRLVKVLLTAYDIDPSSVSKDFLKQVFSSDLNDPKSFVNTQKNTAWAEILGTFNFDTKGKLAERPATGIQSQGKVLETEHKYTRQTLEEEQGESNNGVRLALYFERMSHSITSAYDILGDTALLEFFRVTYQLPENFSNLDVDKQAALVKKYMKLEDLKDPSKVAKMVNKFTVMYDVQNSDASSSALSILTGNGNTVGISADLLYSLSQNR